MRFTAISSVLFLASTVYGSVVPCLDCVTKVTDKTGISATVNAGTTIVGCAFDAAAGVKTGVVNLPIGKTVTVEQVTAYVVSGAVIQADLSYNLAHYLLSQAVFAGLVASETSIDLICNAAYEAAIALELTVDIATVLKTALFNALTGCGCYSGPDAHEHIAAIIASILAYTTTTYQIQTTSVQDYASSFGSIFCQKLSVL